MKAIIFDCFGVLYLNSSQYFYETYVANYEELQPALARLNRESDYGLINQTELHSAISDLTGIPVSLIEQNIKGLHYRNQELIDLSQSLRPQHKIGMLSNVGVHGMDEYFSIDERKKLFDATVLSGEEGITKPHPYIYEIMALRLGVSVGDCIMIDDIEDNCSGADAAGMKTILYQTNSQLRSDLTTLLSI